MKRIALLFTTSLFCLQLMAQEKSDSSILDPVEVKAIRASATAPFAKTNLNRQDIASRNLGQDLPFLMNHTPSVIVHSDAGNGVGYTGIRIRGTDATRINITLNGIPFNDAESNGSFFVNLPDFASSVGSIQIQRGVGTSTNGPGAFGGTINLSTNEIHRDAYAETSNSYGSFNTWKHTIKTGTGLINDHFIADLRLSSITSDGYIDRASSDLKAFYFSTAYLGEKNSFRLNVFSGKEKTYQAWYGVSEADLKTNRRINYAGMEKPGAPYHNETDNYNQTHYQFFYNQQIGSHLVLSNGVFLVKGKGYYEQYKANEDYADYSMPDRSTGTLPITSSDLVRQLWLDNDFYGNVLSLQYSKNKTRIDFGNFLSWYDGHHIGKVIWASNGMDVPVHEWYKHPAEKKDASAYVKWQQMIGKGFQSFVDLQYRHVNYELNGFRDNPQVEIERQWNFFNPKLGFSYQQSGWLGYASYSLGNKEPNRDDFEAGSLQQPKAERLHDIEAGIEYGKSTWKSSVNLYYMKYDNQLVLTGKINDVGAYTRTNIPDSYRMGIEMAASWKPFKWSSLAGNLTLSKNRIRNFTEYIDDYDNGGQKSNFLKETDIAYSPAVIGSAILSFYPFRHLGIDLVSKYVSDQYLDNTSNENRKLDAYYTQDLSIRYQTSLKGMRKLDLVFQLNNAFNRKYEPNGYTFSYYYNNELVTENYYFPMAGRNFMAGITIGL